MAAAHPDFMASWTNVAFRPYLLNPELEGKMPVNRMMHAEEKYGKLSLQDAEILGQEGLEYDLHFSFSSEDLISGTLDAHRLNQFVNTVEGTDATFSYRRELMQLFHEEGKALCDRDLLLDVVQRAGADPETACSILESAAYRMDVTWMSREAQKAGIASIPYYRFYTPDGILSLSDVFDEWHILDAFYRSFPRTDCSHWADAAACCRRIVEALGSLGHQSGQGSPADAMSVSSLKGTFKQDFLPAEA